MDPLLEKRTDCKWCHGELAEHQTTYCSKRCQKRRLTARAQRLRNRRKFENEFLPQVKSWTWIGKLAKQSGLTEEEIAERIRERVQAGTVAVWPSEHYILRVGIRKPKDGAST